MSRYLGKNLTGGISPARCLQKTFWNQQAKEKTAHQAAYRLSILSELLKVVQFQLQKVLLHLVLIWMFLSDRVREFWMLSN